MFHSRSKNDCESTSRPLSGSVRNIISSHKNCGNPFSTEDPGIGKLGYYNGPTKTMPISSKGIGFNWGSNSVATNENEEPLRWDQRGNGDPRYASGITDIGAFEIQTRILFQIDTPSELEIRRCTRI
ncbi:MAG: choice-of-anchor Q domain-containing protein, partial [Amphritea sp.]